MLGRGQEKEHAGAERDAEQDAADSGDHTLAGE